MPPDPRLETEHGRRMAASAKLDRDARDHLQKGTNTCHRVWRRKLPARSPRHRGSSEARGRGRAAGTTNSSPAPTREIARLAYLAELPHTTGARARPAPLTRALRKQECDRAACEHFAYRKKPFAILLFHGNGFTSENIAKAQVGDFLRKRDRCIAPHVADRLVMRVAQFQEKAAGQGDQRLIGGRSRERHHMAGAGSFRGERGVQTLSE